MSNYDLFDDLDLDEVVAKPEPKKEEKLKEDIKEAAKEVMSEIKPDLIQNLDDLFDQDEEEQTSLLDDEDYLKKTILEALTSSGSCNVQGVDVSVMKQEDGKFSIYGTKKGKKGNVLLFKDLEDETDAINKATDHAIDALFKGKPRSVANKQVEEKPKEQPYTGPRTIRVWGRDLFTETDPEVTQEQIVEKISRDYGFPEFRKGRVTFDLDKETGILNVGLMFNKKG